MAADLSSGGGGRERILRAASRLFLSQGYAATSTRDIALAAGIRQPSLYHHFATKADILHAVALATVEPSLRKAEELAADEKLQPFDRLMALVDFDVRLLWESDRSSSAFALVAQGTVVEMDGPIDRFSELQWFYRSFIIGSSPGWGDLSGDGLVGVIFSMIEGVVFRRAYEEVDVDEVAQQTMAAVARLLTQPETRMKR
ncbi:TetR/AcrR family transcriptional regulator [Microbacterium rhizomatis]|uniref:TetR/AcrR family transcriptional regulator n=1 Tax=Microbacterium rhizomatis TaxID=1631477 RepID=A0A5J5IXK9_9MICO|nr:TetR/AcrR family transcriptional regulator [Microbacterium rhizomatis]KAA9106040.1 TetR/AcrR family transcriptional regulator [Microbacterium rhizomatis]